MNSAHSYTEGMDYEKPKFIICFQYWNEPKIRPNQPYLIPANEAAREFKSKYYGKNGMTFNRNCG